MSKTCTETLAGHEQMCVVELRIVTLTSETHPAEVVLTVRTLLQTNRQSIEVVLYFNAEGTNCSRHALNFAQH